MGLTNVAGVFSRYFIVGFFLPVFFALAALAQVVDTQMLPAVYETASSGAKIAILGGAALAGGLLLLGLNYNVLRLFEGYPLKKLKGKWLVGLIYKAPLAVQERRYRTALRKSGLSLGEDKESFDDIWRLGERFPYDRSKPQSTDLLLPTSFGNALRAQERRPFANWHLNGVGASQHIENLLTEQEAQVQSDSKGDMSFFVNGATVAVLCAAVLGFDIIRYQSSSALWFIAIPLAVAWVCYRASIGAAQRWGLVVAASTDLHRHELYEKLGVRTPVDFKDERDIAWHVNSTLLLGKRLPNELALPKTSTVEASGDVSADTAVQKASVARRGLGALLLLGAWLAFWAKSTGQRPQS